MHAVPTETELLVWEGLNRVLQDADPAMVLAASAEVRKFRQLFGRGGVKLGLAKAALANMATEVGQKAAMGECAPDDAEAILRALRAAREVAEGDMSGPAVPFAITISTPGVDPAAQALAEAVLPDAYHRHRSGR